MSPQTLRAHFAGFLREHIAVTLADALADAPTVDDALRRWSDAQLQAAAQITPNAEGIERSYVFGMPDVTAMTATAANDWMSAAYAGLPVTLPRP